MQHAGRRIATSLYIGLIIYTPNWFMVLVGPAQHRWRFSVRTQCSAARRACWVIHPTLFRSFSFPLGIVPAPFSQSQEPVHHSARWTLSRVFVSFLAPLRSWLTAQLGTPLQVALPGSLIASPTNARAWNDPSKGGLSFLPTTSHAYSFFDIGDT